MLIISSLQYPSVVKVRVNHCRAVASTSSSSAVTTSATTSTAGSQPAAGAVTDIGPIKATTPMWRCSRIMHIQRDMHPTVLSALEGIVDQVCTHSYCLAIYEVF